MEIILQDDRTLEASLPREKSLNKLFSELERQGIHVLSMRNKANRLEELFLRLVDKTLETGRDVALTAACGGSDIKRSYARKSPGFSASGVRP